MNVKMLKEKLAGRPEGLPMYILSHDGLDLFEVKEAIVGCDGQDIDCLLLTPPGDNRMNDGRYMCSGVEMDFIKRDVRMRRRGYNGQDVDCILHTPPEDERRDDGHCMCFGAALELLKLGARMRRRGWNEFGLYIELQRSNKDSEMAHPFVCIDSITFQRNNSERSTAGLPNAKTTSARKKSQPPQTVRFTLPAGEWEKP